MGKKKKKNKGKKGGERNKGKRGGKRGGKERKKKSKPKSQAEAGLTFWSWINKWKMPGDIPGCHQWASATCLMELGICSHSDTARAVAPSLPQKEPAAAQERTGCGSTSEGLCASSCPCPSSSAWGLPFTTTWNLDWPEVCHVQRIFLQELIGRLKANWELMNWLLLKEPQAWAGQWNCQHRGLQASPAFPGCWITWCCPRSFSQKEVMLLILIPLLPTETGLNRSPLLPAVLLAGTEMPHFGLLPLEHTPCKP